MVGREGMQMRRREARKEEASMGEASRGEVMAAERPWAVWRVRAGQAHLGDGDSLEPEIYSGTSLGSYTCRIVLQMARSRPLVRGVVRLYSGWMSQLPSPSYMA